MPRTFARSCASRLRAGASVLAMLWLVLTFVLLLLLTHWITRHVQGIGYLLTGDGQIALALYFLIMLPGVLLHETSHVLAAWFLRVKVRRFSIGIRPGRGQKIALGSVEIAHTDPIRSSVIGLAPLTSGCAAILLIGSRVLGLDGLTAFDWQRFRGVLQGIYHTPDFWLWMYLVFAIGNAMLPSEADRRSWRAVGLFLALASAVFYFTGLFDVYSDSLGRWIGGGASQLAYAFAVIIAVDVIVAVLLLIVEQSLGLLGVGRLEYH